MGVLGGQLEFLGVGPGQADHVAGEFDHRALHAQADAEEGDVVGARIADGRDLALHAPGAEAAGHENAVQALEPGGHVLGVDLLGIQVLQVDLDVVGHAGVHQGLMQALVRFLEVHVLAHDADAHLALGVFQALDQGAPGAQIRVLGRQLEQ